MLRLSMPLINVHDLPSAIKSRSRFSSSGVQRTLGMIQSLLGLEPELDQAADYAVTPRNGHTTTREHYASLQGMIDGR